MKSKKSEKRLYIQIDTSFELALSGYPPFMLFQYVIETHNIRDVDKILPYEKFRLPASISFNDALISSNNRFIEEIEKHIDEIRGS